MLHIAVACLIVFVVPLSVICLALWRHNQDLKRKVIRLDAGRLTSEMLLAMLKKS